MNHFWKLSKALKFLACKIIINRKSSNFFPFSFLYQILSFFIHLCMVVLGWVRYLLSFQIIAGKCTLYSITFIDSRLYNITLMSTAFNTNPSYLTSRLFHPDKPRIGASTYLNVNLLPDFLEYIKTNLAPE